MQVDHAVLYFHLDVEVRRVGVDGEGVHHTLGNLVVVQLHPLRVVLRLKGLFERLGGEAIYHLCTGYETAAKDAWAKAVDWFKSHGVV